MSLRISFGRTIGTMLILMLLRNYRCFLEGTKASAVQGTAIIPPSEATDEYPNEGVTTLASEHFEASVNPFSRQKRQIDRRSTRWVGNKVFYYFDPSVEEEAREIVKRALSYIAARTCIDFHEDPTAINRIRVNKGRICFSFVGMQGGEQDLFLNRACSTVGSVVHEIMHALGIWHMQMRDDRDRYIRVNLSSVPKGKEINYGYFDKSRVINYTPYDYGSVMHYDAKSFAKSGISLIPLQKRFLQTIGSKIPSFYDILMINAHCKCNARCAASQTAICFNDGMPNPRDCSVCLCPTGYGGAYCNRRPAGCGETLRASPLWRTETISFERTPTHTDRIGYMMCTYWIKAPPRRKIQIQVTKVPTTLCEYGCTKNAIEPKTLKDKRATNPRICCQEQLYEILTSKLNPAPIFSYSMNTTSTFTFQYKYI